MREDKEGDEEEDLEEVEHSLRWRRVERVEPQ